MLDLNSKMVVDTVNGLRLRQRGVPDQPILAALVEQFVMDVTVATWDNTGPDLVALGRPLTPYAGTGAGGVYTVTSTFGALSYVGVDFTGTRVKRSNTALAVSFTDCEFGATWASTQPSTDVACVELRFSPDAAKWTFTRCSFENLAQNGFVNIGLTGENFTATRCRFRDFQDNLNLYVDSTRVGLDSRIELAGCFFGEAAMFWAPTGGIVHPSDTVSHSDLNQIQGARKIHIHGCTYAAYWSPRIGVGTPRSGSEFVTGVSYTQAAGEAKRAELLAAGQDAPTAVMVNIARGDIPEMNFHHNRGGGGTYFMNAAGPFGTEPGLAFNYGTVHHNTIKRDQFRSVGGATVVFGLDTTAVVDFHDNFEANADWTPSASAIAITRI